MADEEILSDIMDNANVYIYPHLHFYIGYNGDQIVAIQISTDVSLFRRRFFQIDLLCDAFVQQLTCQFRVCFLPSSCLVKLIFQM